MSSENVLNRAVCSEESRVMFIEGVATTALWDCFCCEAIKKEMELSVAAPLMDIYLQQEANLFCVANPLQVRMELATEIVLCFPSPLCCQNPSLCRMAIGPGRQEWGKACVTPMKIVPMAFCCQRGWIL